MAFMTTGPAERRTAKRRKPAPPTGAAAGSAIFSDRAWAEIGRSLKLSRRELEIARGVFDDRTEFAIAADLGISAHTVHTHFERLYRKLGVKGRVELILRVTNEFLALTAAPGSVLPPICADRANGRCPLRGD